MYMALGACCKVVIWAVFYLGSRTIASEQFVKRGATASYSKNHLCKSGWHEEVR